MPPAPKLQRWLDLIVFLSGRRFLVTLEELMEGVPAYTERWDGDDSRAHDSVRRMFERDKDELRAAGIPIETRTFRDAEGNDAVSGYHLSSRNFYLPYVRLLPVQPLLLIFTS